MLFPSIVIMSWIGPQYWLPTLELVWGVLTCCLSTVKTYQQVYIIRAFIGLAEGCIVRYPTARTGLTV